SDQLEPPAPVDDKIEELSSRERERFSGLLQQTGSTKSTRELQRNITAALPVVLGSRKHPSARTREAVEQLLRYYWVEQALIAYRRCYGLGLDQSSGDPDGGLGPGIEAARAMARILQARIPQQSPGWLARLLGGSLSSMLGIDDYGGERA